MKLKFPNRKLSFVIFAFAFLQYANTLGHDFAWDDKIVIQENERVQEGISGIPDLFRKYSSDLRQDKYGYRPITLITFATEYSLFGDNPAGYHFMNILYFAVLCLVIFWVMRRLFESLNPLIPFLITMLFAAHPLHVEVVANIKSRDEILAMLFGILAIYHFLGTYLKGGWKGIVFGSVFYLLAFLSRENAVTFLALIPLALLIQGKVKWKPFLRSTLIIPILGILTIMILNYSMNSQLGQEKTVGFGVYEESHILGNSFFGTQHFGNRFANALHLIVLYIKNFILPYPLKYYSGYNVIPVTQVELPVIIGLLLLLGLNIFAFIRFRKNSLIAFGILFFFISLSIYLQIFQSLSDTMADRFMFVPSLGLCILMVGVLVLLLKPFKNLDSPIQKLSQLSRSFSGIFLVIIVSFSTLTFTRNPVWKNDFTLVSHDLPYLDNSARAHYYYASLLNEKLQKNGWNESMEIDMIYHYQRSIEISDSIYYGRLELATYYLNNKQFREGDSVLRETVRVFPHTSDPRYYLGQSYVDQKRYAAAIPQLEKSIELAPRSHDSYYLLSIAYAKLGRYDDGIQLAREGLKKFPEASLSMYEALGHIYFEQGNMIESTNNTLKMIDFGKDAYTVYATIIGRFQERGDNENAALYYKSAVTQGIMQSETSPN